MKSYLIESFPELSQSIKDATTVTEIMNIIKRRCTIIDISMIEAIVTHYTITEGIELVEDYKEKIDCFCSEISLRFMLDKIFLAESFLICETIQFVLDWEPEEHTLDDILRLIKKAFKDLNKRIIIKGFSPVNSISITCCAPHHLLAALFLEAKDNLTVLIKEFNLISLTIGHFTVYDKRIRYKV